MSGLNEISGYVVEKIAISKCEFECFDPFYKGKVEISFGNIVSNKVTKTIANCTFSIKFDVKTVDAKNLAKGLVTANGRFKLKDSPNLPIQKFADLNANAIIYPFLREYVANLSLKAGMTVILLPSVNFVAYARKEAEASIDE